MRTGPADVSPYLTLGWYTCCVGPDTEAENRNITLNGTMELKQITSNLFCVLLLILLALESHVHANDGNLTTTSTTDGNVTHNPHDVHSHAHTHVHTTAVGTDHGGIDTIDWTSTPVIIGIVGAAIGVLGLVIAIVCAVRAGKAQSKVRRLQSKGPEYRELNQMPSA
ncbi:uncharacterized protein LOC144874407 [Branchiostoma floridae x Branchiostoma japonicum]